MWGLDDECVKIEGALIDKAQNTRAMKFLDEHTAPKFPGQFLVKLLTKLTDIIEKPEGRISENVHEKFLKASAKRLYRSKFISPDWDSE